VTLTVEQRQRVDLILSQVRGAEQAADGKEPAPAPGVPRPLSLARPSVPRAYHRCIYCGQLGAKVCKAHRHLLVEDPMRAPELYRGTCP
jgi:hypothetical protein